MLLNLAGAMLVYFTIRRVQPMHVMAAAQSPLAAMLGHWRNPSLRAAFAIGFCILFAFIGTFTFVNFVLDARAAVAGAYGSRLGLFCVRPFCGDDAVCRQRGRAVWHAAAIWGALAVAGLGLPLMLSSRLAVVLTGMVLVGAGTFFAQAAATGFVGQAARENRGVGRAGRISPCYFLGGLVGSAVLGQLFDHLGWIVCVTGIGASLAIAAGLTVRLRA